MADIKIAGRIKAGTADNIAGYASEILFDDEASNKTVKEKLEGKQDTLTFDNVPTEGSNNPVKSGGVYQAIQSIDVSGQISGKADKSEMSVVAGTGANADKTTITLKSGTSATVLTQHQDVSEFLREGEVFGSGDDSAASFNSYADTVWNKQQTLSESQKQQVRENIGITDLETIRNGAAAGATAIQSVTVGTTTTGAAGSSASVVNSGTATAPVLDFTIPQGAQGIKGDTVIMGNEDTYTLYNTTGDAVDGAMTQQAVTRELAELSGELSPRPIYNADNMNCDFPKNSNDSYVYTRYRMGFEIDSVPQTVRVSNFPSGYTFSIQGYSSQADAFNSTLSPIDYGNWGETEHTFTNQSIRYIALNIKNNSNTSMSNSDTANFSNIIVTIIVDGVTIDDVPMQGSMNLVRSNGIYDAVSPIPSIQNNVNELNLTLYGSTEPVSKGLEDAEIVLVNSSLQEVTSVTSAFRLRLLYQLPKGTSFNVRCTLYNGVAMVLYPTRQTAVIGDNDYLENYTNGYSTSEVIGETGYNGYLSISWKNSNGSNFTQNDYDSFMDNVQISITCTDIEDNSVISRLMNLENGEHKRSVNELLSNNINVISHLGGGSFYGTVAPMNSMWSANLAARMGMRCCEFDIVFTSDDVPICCHDLNISTSGNNEFVRKDGTAITGSTPIGSLTYQQMVDTYKYRQGFAGYEEISTIYDVLKVYRDNNIIPCLEIKDPATSMTATRYNLILKALHDYVGDNFMIVMFDIDNAIALRNLDYNALIGISKQVFEQSMITTAKQYNFFCGLNLNAITSTIIENFKSEGVDLYGWTVSSDVNAALELGLRYFICDYIAEPQTTAGVVDSYISNALDFSNITHTGTVTDNHLILASGQTATITSNVSNWLNSIEAHIIIKGVCTISVGSTNFAVNNADFEEYLVLLREYNKTSETITINGACEIASIECVFKSY